MATKILSPNKSSHSTRGRSYLLPQNLPAKPTDDDLNALEQYLSRVSGSTETLHQGLAKAYLPFVLRNGAATPHQETFQAPIPVPFALNSEEQAQRLALSAHLAAFPGFENYPPSRAGAEGIPASDRGEEQAGHIGDTHNYLHFPSSFRADIPPPNNPTNVDARKDQLPAPLPVSPPDSKRLATASKRCAPEGDKESIAPSQSLSQVASRHKQPATGRRSGNPTPRHDNISLPAVEKRDSKQGTPPQRKEMALLDWARGVSGPLHHHPTTPHPHPAPRVETAGSVAMSQRSRMGGTNIDEAGRSSGSSSTSTERERATGRDAEGRDISARERGNSFGQPQQQFLTDGEPAAASQFEGGGRRSFVDVAQQQRQQTGHGPHYLHPESYPFPLQQLQQPGLTPSASASQYGWQSPAITDRLPRDDEVSIMERLTVGGTTLGGLTTAGGVPFSNMSRMRSALEHELEAGRREDEQVRQSAQTAQHVAFRSITHLESEIRTLQARIISEHVSRSTLEKDVADKAEQAREYRSELATAVRALRRAKEETKKLDEERRKGVRLYEETRERLVKYHEALKVQEARDAGREEGRLEAFHEIERWMTAPPIPIEPLANIPPMTLNPAEQQIRNMRPSARDTEQEDRRFATQQGHRPPPPNRQYPSDSSPEEQLRHRGQVKNNPQFVRADSDQDPRIRDPSRPPQQLSEVQRDYLQQDGYRGALSQQQRPSPGHGPGFVPLRQTPPAHPDTLTPHNAADAYLDRVQYDPRLQGMLAGAPARPFPMTSTNVGPTPHGLAIQQFHSRRPSSTINPLDKPLPLPKETQHRRQPDRYPPFARQPAESILDHAVPVFSPDDQSYRIPAGYVDPRHVPLPDSLTADSSRTASEFGTIVHPGRHTTGPSFVSQNGMTPRSRLAVNLRNEDDLSMIDERDERSVAQERSPPNGVAQDLEFDSAAQAPPSRANVRAARSMQSLPSWKPKPKLVMPKRLGGAGTDIQDLPEVNDEQLRAMYARDNMMHNAISMTPDADTRRPGKSQSMYMPPDRFQSPSRDERSHTANVRARQKAHTVGGFPRVRESSDWESFCI
ncbi:hypothetical protein QFC22_000784 [Naganishia vaughanmartiniae]|uniref:Uncharacterized protein n=1 Tax=Naganishia vaughanmartiniae TaxID=1424756 RepID=A0ACC2XMR3_9TREE|nr:hypothetical protein QFC22_000784 [Naganishia vaughanmartiniae]